MVIGPGLLAFGAVVTELGVTELGVTARNQRSGPKTLPRHRWSHRADPD
jgi:hypothetical protein